MDNAIFLKKNEDGRFIRVNVSSEADYVRVPVSKYISVESWNNLMRQYAHVKKRYEMLRSAQPDFDGETVTIPLTQYNGFLNGLRIIHDRALQQIDRQSADQHGYTLKYADLRAYDRAFPNYKAYLIVKQTPISLKINLEAASFIMIQSLTKYYNYIDISKVSTASNPEVLKISVHDLLKAQEQKRDSNYRYDFYVENSNDGRKIKEYLDGCPDSIIFEVAKISSNIGQGVYEISYWATGLI